MQKLTQWRPRLAKTLYQEFEHLWEFGRNIPLAFRNGCDDHRRRSALLTGYPVELLESDDYINTVVPASGTAYQIHVTIRSLVCSERPLFWSKWHLSEWSWSRLLISWLAVFHISGTWKNSTSQNPMGISLIWIFDGMKRYFSTDGFRWGAPMWPERWSWACFEMVIRRKWAPSKWLLEAMSRLFRHERTEFKKTGNKRASLVRKIIRWNDEMSTIQYDFTILPDTIAV